ncbi:hypothetical protein IG193_08830 [Infirmifilum lucidum]|uniref:Uncharacterized protein n=1 Tax=Infirmifilum lucidum TaxID=2776706 RepID=A0A7L9FIT7_9CREN|nr:hypothetical protein [Infirmifilum lucidum]QOJ78834.1 hypothetical protein IG193_08830 [Infirmifilum lucidum]
MGESERRVDRLDILVGYMGGERRDVLEKKVLEAFRGALEEKGVEPSRVERLRLRDEDGSLTGVRGRVIDVGVLSEGEEVYVVKAKPWADVEHVESLRVEAEAVGRALGKRVAGVFLVAVTWTGRPTRGLGSSESRSSAATW